MEAERIFKGHFEPSKTYSQEVKKYQTTQSTLSPVKIGKCKIKRDKFKKKLTAKVIKGHFEPSAACWKDF